MSQVPLLIFQSSNTLIFPHLQTLRTKSETNESIKSSDGYIIFFFSVSSKRRLSIFPPDVPMIITKVLFLSVLF